jgi:predicted metal-dependent phosphoesterase TrpH
MRNPGAEDRGDISAQGLGPVGTLDPDDNYPFHRRPEQPVPAGRQGAWLAFSNHNHSSYWDGKQPLTYMQQQAYLQNLDAMALTDHNTMRGTSSHEFLAPPPGLIMVKGMEWNAFREKGEPVVGHAGILGMDGEENIATGAGLDEMLAEATRRHATIVINHPFNRGNSWTQSKPDPRAHCVEVWNGWWARVNPIMHNDKALAWWDASLKEGRHLTAVAGTDNHGNWYDSVARNVNMVFAETPDQAGILAGIRAGHVSISASPTAARLYLEADGNGDGTFEAMMGDTVARPAGGKLSVQARVVGGKGKSVVFYTEAGTAVTKGVDSNDATIRVTLPVGNGPAYVRAELKAHPLLPLSMTAVSNPIYVGGTQI